MPTLQRLIAGTDNSISILKDISYHTTGSRQLSSIDSRLTPISRKPISNEYISSFERLPVEIKVEIFSLCLDPYPTLDTNGILTLLCNICTSWRTLIQSTPKLWSSFGVDLPPIGLDSFLQTDHTLKTMDTWLSRSKRYPLSVRLRHDPIGGRSPDTRSARMLAALVPHADRWREIHLSIPDSSITPLQDSLSVAESFRALRCLTLDVRARRPSYPPFEIHALRVPWGRLTGLYLRLDTNPLTLDDCLIILTEGTSLVRCSLNADCAFNTRGSPRNNIPILSMENFELILLRGGRRVTEAPEACLITFLELLEFGKLRKLEINSLIQWDDAGFQHWEEIHPKFVSVLGGLSASLEALKIAYLPLSEGQILDSLMVLPNLVDLDLQFSMADRVHDPITNHLLYALTPKPGNPSHRPLQRLETLHVRCSGARFNSSVLLGFVHSRWTPSPSEKKTKMLKELKFVSLRPVGNFVRQSVETWEEEGLIIAIDGVDV